MSRNIYNYQHSCEKDRDEYLDKKAPFFSKMKIQETRKGKIEKLPFLSEGYYLWENNIKEAFNYGISKINSSEFSVVEFNDVEWDKYNILNLCDSVGRNEFMELLKVTIQKFPKAESKLNQNGLGNFIHYLKYLNKLFQEGNSQGIPFSFCGIKSERVKENNDDENYTYRKGTGYFAPIGAPIMVCLFYDKKKITYVSKRFYHYPENNYQEK